MINGSSCFVGLQVAPKRSIVSKKLSAVHPGEVLREEFLVPMKLSPNAVARVVGVPRTRIERLVNGQTALTADTALRLAKAFRTTPAFWMVCRRNTTSSAHRMRSTLG